MDLLYGISAAMAPENLMYGIVGAFLGTLVGVLPGVGVVSTMALLFPFTAYLPPEGMLITIATVYYGATYGGSTTAILMNVPGEISAVVTAMDGYEMAKQGRPGPALAISAIVSFMAGIVGSVLIAFLGPAAARIAFEFGPAEYLGLGLFTLTAISGLSGKSLLKGLMTALLGLILVSVGYDEISGAPRLTFGRTEFLLGLDIVPVMMGIFGVGEVLRSLQDQMEGRSIAFKVGRLMPNRQEMRDGVGAGVRATAISFPMGLFPGISPSICSFLSYALERQRSRYPEKFGKGAIEGVGAAEAANNAAAMGHFVPLLSLGVPVSAAMALLVAAFNMYGIIPGPTLFTQQAHLVWTLIGSFFVANFILLVMNLPLVGLWARIATIPYPILAPIILVLCIVGAYAVRNNFFDVLTMTVFGLLGWGMRKRNWPLPPLVLAYVLGPIIESSFTQVTAITPGLLLQRPIFWLFVLAGSLSIWFSRRLPAAELG